MSRHRKPARARSAWWGFISWFWWVMLFFGIAFVLTVILTVTA